MLVELDRLVQIELGVGEEAGLHGASADALDNGGGGHALVDMQRHRLDIEGQMLGLARPLELWIEARIVLIAFPARGHRIHISDTSGRVIQPRLVVAVVGGVRRRGSGTLTRGHR